MKKTKIIVPALGMLLISTAASVTGTVAWFTANRSVSLAANTFKVTSMDGSLKAKQSAIVGTETLASAAATSAETHGSEAFDNIVTAKDFEIGDSSFYEGETPVLYTDVPADDADTQPTTYRSLGGIPAYGATYGEGTGKTLWKVSDNSESAQWYAVAWNIILRYEFKDTNDIDVYFNYQTSNASGEGTKDVAGNTVGNDGKHTKLGFRICIMSDQNTIVWAPMQVKNKCTRVTSTTTSAAYGDDVNLFTSEDHVATAANATLHADRLSTASEQKDYIDTFSYVDCNAGTDYVEKTLTVVAWFEGTDENVVNTASLDTVSANLNFYCRQSYTNKAAA